jgi:hypothetical protein
MGNDRDADVTGRQLVPDHLLDIVLSVEVLRPGWNIAVAFLLVCDDDEV